ncbi:hypothetical protein VaNZ11_005038 [Volvox africanus]|uniref:UBA domain-containing protein n=1 Tax=Volvox africanus TaxID=51714 RepID=A0ABQ5RXX9_9CHLO|nr:hypothetical protein VaNZ11_005038 [Volvox africanus]
MAGASGAYGFRDQEHARQPSQKRQRLEALVDLGFKPEMAGKGLDVVRRENDTGMDETEQPQRQGPPRTSRICGRSVTTTPMTTVHPTELHRRVGPVRADAMRWLLQSNVWPWREQDFPQRRA